MVNHIPTARGIPLGSLLQWALVLVDLCELSDFRFLNSQIFTVFVEFLESGVENSSEFGIILTAPPVIYSEVSL